MRDTKTKQKQIAPHQSHEKTKKEYTATTNTNSTISNSFYGLYFDRPYLLNVPFSYCKNANFQQCTCRFAEQGIPSSLFLWKCRMFSTWSNYIFIAVTPKRSVLGMKIWFNPWPLSNRCFALMRRSYAQSYLSVIEYNQQLMNEAEYFMKNYGDRVGCYPSRP